MRERPPNAVLTSNTAKVFCGDIHLKTFDLLDHANKIQAEEMNTLKLAALKPRKGKKKKGGNRGGINFTCTTISSPDVSFPN